MYQKKNWVLVFSFMDLVSVDPMDKSNFEDNFEDNLEDSFENNFGSDLWGQF